MLENKTILYVHGFGSSGQSGTVGRLRQMLPEATIVAPDLPIHPEEALALLRQTCSEAKPDLIIGTSMGGMYAEMLEGFDRILVNPAFGIAETMQSHGLTGKQQFFSPRKDGVQEFYVDKPLVKEYRAASERNFLTAANPGEQQRVWGLFGDEDTTVDTRDIFLAHYPQAVPFHGGHRLNDHSLLHAVLPIARWIDDRQENRQRPTVFVGIETLADSYGKPASSSQKTVASLIETYQLFFVAPAETQHPERYAEREAWIADSFGPAAWGHTVFTNQRHLLLGDYLIEKSQTKDAMATSIVFGSPSFKSWEDIADYFSLLGGQ